LGRGWLHIKEKVFAKLHLLLCVVRRAAALNHRFVHLILGPRRAREERLYALSVSLASLAPALFAGERVATLIELLLAPAVVVGGLTGVGLATTATTVGASTTLIVTVAGAGASVLPIVQKLV